MSRTEQQARRWPTRRLGEVLIRHNDVVHPGQRTGEATFVGLEHIEPNSGRRIGSATLDLGSLTGRKPTFRRGQIVYGYLRPYLNKVWVAEFDGYSSVDQFAFDVRPELADTEFVAAFMRSETFLRRSSIVTTTGQLPRIGTEQIAAVPIELPPLDVQRCIVSKLADQLGAAAVAKRAAEERVAVAEAMSASYLDQILGAQVSATSKHLPLASFAVEISKGTTPLSFGYPYTVDGVPFVTAEDLAENGVAVDSVTRCVSDECHAFLRRSQLEPNDVLISIAGTLGRVSFMPEDSRPANCNQAVCFIRLNQSLVDRRFLVYVLRSRSVQTQLLAQRLGGGVTNLNLPMVRHIQVPDIPLEAQGRIARLIADRQQAVEILVRRCVDESDTVGKLAAALLRAAFNGAS